MRSQRPRLRSLGPRIGVLDSRTAKPPPKTADPIYHSPEHRAWRAEVIRRAGGRCQASGCTKAAPQHRMYADHVQELQDGGAPFDPANGQCLCAEHHTLKTAAERAKRMRG